MSVPERARKPQIFRPEQGRKYGMGRMRAVFFADGAETDGRYSISEWWLEPRTANPGEHSHENDHIYRVLAGTLTVSLAGEQTEAPRGSYILIPGGTSHGFENRGAEECGFISINAPGGFEKMMPDIVKYFAENPLGEVGTCESSTVELPRNATA
jgi:mannose-6-phosphate isomerase-like protein (cupin superfamily)